MEQVLNSPRRVGMEECSHEEDDTHLILHMSLPQKVMIRTIDTNVVLAVAKMADFDANEPWIASGTGKQFR